MEPEWWGELREILEAAGRQDLLDAVREAFVEAQKNATWTCASACKGHLENALDDTFRVWLEGRIPGWAEVIVNTGSREELPDAQE